MNNVELTDIEKRDLEIRALETLLENGYLFSVPLKLKYKDVPKWIKWLNKHNIPVKWRDKRLPEKWLTEVVKKGNEFSYTRNIRINPLYLGTIDSIRKLYLTIDFDENKLQENPIKESKRLFQYTSVMADIAAIASINTGEIEFDKYNKEFREYRKFYISHLTPDLLLNLVVIINQMCNPAGFTRSIRLIMGSVNGATNPKADLVE
jgi:hypothetical protein